MKLIIIISLQNRTESTQNDMIVEKHREMDGRAKDIKIKVQVMYTKTIAIYSISNSHRKVVKHIFLISLQDTEQTIKNLEDQQDEYDFKSKTLQSRGNMKKCLICSQKQLSIKCGHITEISAKFMYCLFYSRKFIEQQ